MICAQTLNVSVKNRKFLPQIDTSLKEPSLKINKKKYNGTQAPSKSFFELVVKVAAAFIGVAVGAQKKP